MNTVGGVKLVAAKKASVLLLNSLLKLYFYVFS